VIVIVLVFVIILCCDWTLIISASFSFSNADILFVSLVDVPDAISLWPPTGTPFNVLDSAAYSHHASVLRTSGTDIGEPALNCPFHVSCCATSVSMGGCLPSTPELPPSGKTPRKSPTNARAVEILELLVNKISPVTRALELFSKECAPGLTMAYRPVLAVFRGALSLL
jgi:hypothetical protein